jgi:hypothetical protein
VVEEEEEGDLLGKQLLVRYISLLPWPSPVVEVEVVVVQ